MTTKKANNKCRAFTSLEQSKELEKFLPPESADMEYLLSIKGNGSLIGTVPFVKDDSEVEDSAYSHIYNRIACWSLAALLKVIPKHIKNDNTLRIDIDEKDFSIWYDEVGCGVNTELPDITMENPVDACYKLIVKLHELKML